MKIQTFRNTMTSGDSDVPITRRLIAAALRSIADNLERRPAEFDPNEYPNDTLGKDPLMVFTLEGFGAFDLGQIVLRVSDEHWQDVDKVEDERRNQRGGAI